MQFNRLCCIGFGHAESMRFARRLGSAFDCLVTFLSASLSSLNPSYVSVLSEPLAFQSGEPPLPHPLARYRTQVTEQRPDAAPRRVFAAILSLAPPHLLRSITLPEEKENRTIEW
jgi:hypothetical protein